VLRPNVRCKDLVGALRAWRTCRCSAPRRRTRPWPAGATLWYTLTRRRCGTLTRLAWLGYVQHGGVRVVRVPVAALSPRAAMDGGASGSDASGGGGGREPPTPLAELLERLRGGGG
jgi:hypothetical protein